MVFEFGIARSKPNSKPPIPENNDPIVIPLPLPQMSPAPQTYGDNQQITSVISGGERSNPFEFLDFQG